ncbi:MAG: phytanoyl-CoA dioxygenase family protein [Azoarcus sp.]|nr:phytanoyl-CoA dioxygenase family protein [Azoarcus sp.]
MVVIRGALDTHAMRHAQRAFHWSLQHPGPRAHTVLAGIAGAFYQDHANPAAFPAYHDLLCETGLTELVGNLIGSQGLWLLYEQIWLKRGRTLRTPWHQDLAYVPMAGEQVATAWINLDPVERERSLEFVRGSHRGLLYNPTAFDPDDPTAAMYAPGVWPALPDIEARRDAWPIVSTAIEPGDIVVFHPAVLHGGAPTRAGEQRRTISLRFFGDDTVCMPRPESGVHEIDRLTTDDGSGDPMVAMARQPAGTLFRHPGFRCLRSPDGATSGIRASHE